MSKKGRQKIVVYKSSGAGAKTPRGSVKWVPAWGEGKTNVTPLLLSLGFQSQKSSCQNLEITVMMITIIQCFRLLYYWQ